jgi:hypothetical protein
MLQPAERLTSVALHMEEASVKKTFLTGEFSEVVANWFTAIKHVR